MARDLSPLFEGILFQTLIAAGLLLPIFAVSWWLQRNKSKYDAKGIEPFTELPLRPPGESLRVRIEELEAKFNEALVVILMALAASVGFLFANPRSWIVVVPVTLLLYLWFGRKIVRIAERLRPLRLGFKGERAVGEELNQLLRHGFHVFHDLPFGSHNLDHVVVGPPGVYVIETKTRRKPRDLSGRPKATVIFDGGALWFPKFTDRAGVEQARRNAESLSAWLTDATGEPVRVRAILTLPGWWVDRKARGEVNVLNPDEIKHSFPTRPANPLSPALIQRIAFQLAEKSRERRGTESKK